MNSNTFVQKDAELKDLIEILTWCRGAGTQSERDFVAQHIATIPNIWPDQYGNYHLTIGENPTVLWSSHTDTVTRKEGRQNVKWVSKGVLGLNNGQQGQCLGADDGAGVWLMMELIKAQKPGHYVFHRDEEIGGLGSTWISKNSYVLPDSIRCAIAMDRCDTRDVITHQGFSRCASDQFAKSLCRQLPAGMVPDDTGVFTDTANYVDLIDECTNLSVGYQRNHGKDETLDTVFLRELRDCLLKLDYSKLEFSRKAGDMEYVDYYGHSAYYGGGKHTYSGDTTGAAYTGNFPWDDDNDDDRYAEYMRHDVDRSPLSSGGGTSASMREIVEEAPEIAARLLEELGVSTDEMRAHVFALTGRMVGV